MKEYAVVYKWEPYVYPFTDYVIETELDELLAIIEKHPDQSLIEYYEV